MADCFEHFGECPRADPSELGLELREGHFDGVGKGNCYDNAAVETFFKTPSRDHAAHNPAGQWMISMKRRFSALSPRG
jgi:hypothetical protein